MNKWITILVASMLFVGCKDIRKEYHENGNVSLIAEYEGNFIDGKLERFDKTGNKIAEEYYKKGLKDGTWKTFNSKGVQLTEENYKDDLHEGIQKIFYDSGLLKGEYNAKNDLPNGAVVEYYENGNKKMTCTMVAGIKDGNSKDYFEDGTLFRDVEFEHGKFIHLKEYHPNGQLHLDQSYKNGVVDKKTKKEYDKNGVTIFEFIEKGLKDTRDGKTYNVVTIGYQTWMAENLNYAMSGSGCTQSDAACKKFGRLYPWELARKACPSGWHLPSQKELQKLANYAGGSKADKKLMANYGWESKQKGTDDFLFSALPAGPAGVHLGAHNHTVSFWSSTEKPRDFDYAYVLSLGYIGFSKDLTPNAKDSYESIRCIKNSK